MKAVTFHGVGDIRLSQREIPRIQSTDDVIVKVQYAGLCGSDLHSYRGTETPSAVNFINGHEFIGHIHDAGSTTFTKGEYVVSPFTVSCGNCWFCEHQYSARCVNSLLFGSPDLDGGQAEYVRVPFAQGTLISLSSLQHRIKDPKTLLFLGDVYPTGYYAAKNALIHKGETVAVLGCGPVGLSTIIALSHLHNGRIIAIDSVPSRLLAARTLGATAIPLDDDTIERVKEYSNYGVDAVCEVVGSESAIELAVSLLRPFGVLSSVGVHGDTKLPILGSTCFSKNITMIFGRCPVRSIMTEAVESLIQQQDKFTGFVDHVCPIDECREAYTLFNDRKVNKVVFDMQTRS